MIRVGYFATYQQNKYSKLKLKEKKMKKKFGKIAVLFLVIVMLVGLAACGNGTDAPTSGNETPGQGTSSGNGSTGGGTTGGGSSGNEPVETLKIGLLINVTGWFASVDLSVLYATEAFASIINEQGGWDIGGKKYMIELVVSDIQSDFGNVQAAALYLLDQDVKFVIESIDFFVASVQPLWEEHGVMHMITTSSGNPMYGGPNHPHAFSAGANGLWSFIPNGMRLIQENFPDVRKLIYVENDTGDNQATWEFMNAHASTYGLEMISYANSAVYAGEATDLATVALQVINSGADAVITTGPAPNTAGILKEIRSLGNDMPYVICTLTGGEVISMIAGADYSHNSATLGYSIAPEDNTEMWNRIAAKLVETHGENAAIDITFMGVNAMYVLLQVMSIANSTDVNTVMDTWRSLETIDTIFGPGNMGGLETFGLDRQWLGSPTSFCIITKGGIRYLPRIPTFIP